MKLQESGSWSDKKSDKSPKSCNSVAYNIAESSLVPSSLFSLAQGQVFLLSQVSSKGQVFLLSRKSSKG